MSHIHFMNFYEWFQYLMLLRTENLTFINAVDLASDFHTFFSVRLISKSFKAVSKVKTRWKMLPLMKKLSKKNSAQV